MMKNTRKVRHNVKQTTMVTFLAVMVLLAGSDITKADDTAVAGRKILESYHNAVVKVETVSQIKWLMNGSEMQNREFKNEITGTVIDPSGLVLVSLTAVDPSRFMDSLMRGAGDDMKMDIKIDLKSVKIILPDATEIDAKVVLRDRDMDMAFIRTKQKMEKSIVSVNLNDQANPRVMDEIVVLGRLSKVARYAPSAMAARIAAIVSKPRTFYIPQMEGGDPGYIGTPAFSLDGKPIGVILIRILDHDGAVGFNAMMGGSGAMGITAVIMPMAEILEASKQAPNEPKAKE